MSEFTRAVLILDDDDTVRESLAGFFEDRGWRVLSAATAEEARDVLSRESPAGAVVDIRLPGMDGNEFMRAASATHPRLAYVICTGSPEYLPPADIAALPQVSENVFTKPVVDLSTLEQELCRQIEICGVKGPKHE